jgi:hypothetical protein
MSGSEADLLAVMRADRQAQDKRRADQAAGDPETAGPRPRRRRPNPTDDKINEAFKQATSC